MSSPSKQPTNFQKDSYLQEQSRREKNYIRYCNQVLSKKGEIAKLEA